MNSPSPSSFPAGGEENGEKLDMATIINIFFRRMASEIRED
jgi:hypothetical protein